MLKKYRKLLIGEVDTFVNASLGVFGLVILASALWGHRVGMSAQTLDIVLTCVGGLFLLGLILAVTLLRRVSGRADDEIRNIHKKYHMVLDLSKSIKDETKAELYRSRAEKAWRQITFLVANSSSEIRIYEGSIYQVVGVKSQVEIIDDALENLNGTRALNDRVEGLD